MSKTVVLDPGHGGSDPGAVGNGLYEKDLTLDIGLRTRDYLTQNYEVRVLMTRDKDVYVSLEDRVAFANNNNADLFFSIHNNSFSDPSANGYEDFIHSSLSDTSTTAKIRDVIHEENMAFLKQYDIRDRGKKKADFYVLRNTRMSAVLVENLFITNYNEANLLKHESFRQGLAVAHAKGIARALGLKKKSGNTSTGSTKPKQSGLHRVIVNGKQIGAYADPKNVLKQIEKNLGKEIKIEPVK